MEGEQDAELMKRILASLAGEAALEDRTEYAESLYDCAHRLYVNTEMTGSDHLTRAIIGKLAAYHRATTATLDKITNSAIDPHTIEVAGAVIERAALGKHAGVQHAKLEEQYNQCDWNKPPEDTDKLSIPTLTDQQIWKFMDNGNK